MMRAGLYQPSIEAKIASSASCRLVQVPVDQLGFQAAEERFGHGVVVAVADRSGGGCRAGVGEALGEPQRGVLLRFKGSLQQWLLVRLRVGDRSGLRRGCAIPVSCGDGRSMQ
jgi:hypothetical protein